ncbi:MAG: WHG domain-containing protein [Bacillota bacterium]|nr:WHG domain-containing protein [Bacillota bacterium]
MSPRPKISLDLSTILKVAVDIADQNGFEEVTLANLAKKLSIRPPSLYNHFEGLPDLRKKLAIYGLNQLYSELVNRSIGILGEKAVLALSLTYVNFARNHPGLYEATLQAPDPIDSELQTAGGKIVELTLQVLHAYQLPEENALHAVRGLRSILHGFATLEQKGGFAINLDLNESLTFIIKAFLKGIRELSEGIRTPYKGQSLKE